MSITFGYTRFYITNHGTCHPEYTKLIEEIQGGINVYKNKTMATQEFGQL